MSESGAIRVVRFGYQGPEGTAGSSGTAGVTGPAGPSGVTGVLEIPFVTGENTTQLSTAFRKGGRKIDWTRYPAVSAGGLTRSVRLTATLDSSVSAALAEVDLYDQTHGVIIAGSTLTNTAAPDKTIPYEVTSGILPVNAISGNLRNDVIALYLLRIRRNGGLSTDAVTCTNARLEITYA